MPYTRRRAAVCYYTLRAVYFGDFSNFRLTFTSYTTARDSGHGRGRSDCSVRKDTNTNLMIRRDASNNNRVCIYRYSEILRKASTNIFPNKHINEITN